MTTWQPPAPTADLIAKEKQLSAKPMAVLSFLQSRPRGSRVVDIAQALGMHSNTVRGHLEELAAHGLIESSLEKPTGRGRPTHRYWSCSPRPAAVATEYLSLAEILIETVGDPAHPRPEDHEKARELGRAWARRSSVSDSPWTSSRQAIEELVIYLRSMGFRPERRPSPQDEEPERIDLFHCPFVVGDTPPSPLICSLHLGFIEELTQQCPVRVGLRPMSRPGRCSVDLYPEVGGASTST